MMSQKVKFRMDYRGYENGSVHEFVDFLAADYIDRKIVEPYVEDDKKDALIADLKKENAILKGKITKQVNAAPMNKQVTNAANKQ